MEIKTILVDDEILAMRLFELECARFEDIRIIAKFESPVKAIAYAEEHDVDMAILDIEMPEMNGIELGKELRKRRKDIILIFITAHTQYAMVPIRSMPRFIWKNHTAMKIWPMHWRRPG